MNKKEIAEIKKQIKTNNYRFVVNKIANAYIVTNGSMRDTKYLKIHNPAIMPESEYDIYLENAKKTLSGQLGKGLVEYVFPKEAYEEYGGQYRLYELLKSKLEDEAEVKSYVSYMVQKLNYSINFYITIMHCSYSIPTKDKNDEEDEEFDAGNVYDFLIVSVNMSSLTNIGLIYNEQDRVVEKKVNTDLEISEAPCDGFIFPTYNERNADVNSVLCFTKTPKKPNEEMVTDVLGCNFTISSEEEKQKFANILTKTIGDNLTYDIYTNIQENVRDIIAETEMETEMPTLNKNEVKALLQRSGVEDEYLEEYDEIYEAELQDLSLKPVNMMDSSKIGIKAPDITINIKAKGANKVRTQTINNKNCIVIEIDDSIEVNGLDVLP